MIIMDPEKQQLAASENVAHLVHDDDDGACPPYEAVEKHGMDNKCPRVEHTQCRHRRRRFAHFTALSALIILLALKAFSYRDLLARPHHPKPHRHHHRPLTTAQREHLFLSIPSAESALNASRAYATHPHLAGSTEDFDDAKVILELFQSQFGIDAPDTEPLFSAGTPESRNATLKLTTADAPTKPTAWIDVYYPILNTPLNRSLAILGDDGSPVWSADLEEDGDPRDKEAHKYKLAVPAWHGLSRDGDVTGQLVYANYGSKEDYDELVARGANLTGKIVIVRYGGIFRGLKIKGAQELGAAGVLIYSDPRDDGFVTVSNGYTPYPAGPARNPTSVQRGSVQYLSSYPGDPSTPGLPAYENSTREDGTNIPTIPSLPISWANAERLLEEIDELEVVDEVTGERRLTGIASEVSVRLVNHVDTKVTPIWNTMASIPGHIRDEVVVIGCHRDAWVMGAADPTSGTVSLHEIIRGFGALLKSGWKPLRTVVIASWDAEEYGLVGSTEWGEDFPSWISSHVVAYLNVDVSVAGSRWTSGGSPSLAHLIRQTALDVPHPTVHGKTLWDARLDEGPFKGVEGDDIATPVDRDVIRAFEEKDRALRASETGIYPLGSGSDYTVFLQRLGVASSDEGFAFTPSDAVYHYHSIYDSQHWQETYADPGFHRHVAVAKHLGLLGLRLIDSIVLPLNTTQYALELDDYLDKVESLVPSLASSTASPPDFTALRASISAVQTASAALDEEKSAAEEAFKKLLRRLPPPLPHRRGNCKRRSGVWKRAADWVKSVFGVPPPTKAQLRQRRMRRGEVDAWEEYLAVGVEEELEIWGEEQEKEWEMQDKEDEEEMEDKDEAGHPRFPRPPPPPHHLPFPIRKFIKAAKRVSAANKRLIAFERGFISEGGIKDREWYKHLGVAPGKWLGYGATTFPALTEALTIDQNTTLAKHEAARLTQLLEKLAKDIQP